ncbi:hypothetical protein IR083_20850 [Dysgonomonas sp. GY75]|uniref:hypothetical protein n=1 Tax=Dysgonomonas sp. GY75 TaxID=2780419 RepID=UPI0018846841|nr:hypothetical protein [Dysgonomonas sp. GY75]MBF0651271.1 hypothetical protein [Dysgonomonas sp. GY75]
MYSINFDKNAIFECELIEALADKYGKYYIVGVCDKDDDIADEIEVYNIYESYVEAESSLFENIECDLSSQNYACGYNYACGIYD